MSNQYPSPAPEFNKRCASRCVAKASVAIALLGRVAPVRNRQRRR